MKDLLSTTRLNLGWVGIGQVIKQGSVLIVSIILARLLHPSDFGLIGMIFVFTGFAKLIGDLGLGAGLIQKMDLNSSHLNAVFGLNIIMGLLLSVLFWFTAPFIANFYHEDRLVLLIKAISVSFLIEATKVVQTALLEKEMNFKKLTLIEIFSETCSGVIVIMLALFGWGVWSLVIQYLLPAIIATILLWIFSTWRPTQFFHFKAYKDLCHFSLNLLGFNILNYFTRNADNLLVGKYLGSAALGIYTWAYRIMLFPIYQMSGVVTRVMFPALSAIQNDKARVKKIYLRAIRVIALVTFPTMIGIGVLAEPFIRTVLGNQWMGVVPILQILCIGGIRQSVGTTVGWIYTSQGRTDLQFKWNGIVSSVVSVIAFIIGLRWGGVGVALAYVLSGYLILWYPTWAVPLKLINISFTEILHNLSSTFFIAIIMGFLVWGIQQSLPNQWLPWQKLILSALFGALLYWRLIILFKVTSYGDFIYFMTGKENV